MKYLLTIFLLAISLNVSAVTDYRVPITIPSDEKCASGDSEVLIIDEDSDWSQINDVGKTIFCVEPGDYEVNVSATRSGTAGGRRYIRYYNSAETSKPHPVNMVTEDKAILSSLYFLSATEYWTVDRLVFSDATEKTPVRAQAGGGNNIIFNRLLVELSDGNLIALGGDDITVQDSVLRNSKGQVGFDDIALSIRGDNVRIVGNEIYNIRGDNLQIANGSTGGIIAHNELYVTSALYTDCSGNFDTEGNCMCTENALDIKGGAGIDEEFPFTTQMLIIDNKMWGFNRDDDGTGGGTCGTGAGGLGISVVVHGGVLQDGTDTGKGVRFEENFIWAGENNIDSIGVIGANPVSEHYSFINNLWYELNYIHSMPGSKTNYHEWYYNTFMDVGTSWHLGATQNSDHLCNVIINSPDDGVGTQGSGDLYDYNVYFNSDDTDVTNTNDDDYPTAAEANGSAYCWNRYQLTNPTKTCVTNAITARNNPSAGICTGTTETATRGVNDVDQLFRVEPGFMPGFSGPPSGMSTTGMGQ